MQILLVDDDSDFLIFLDKILRANFAGAVIKTALDGSLALKMCEQEKFDLITVDYRMPIMDGLTFVRFLRSEGTHNSNVPIVFISGFLSEFITKLEKFDNVSFLDKPFDQARFVRIVSLACNELSEQQKDSE